MGNAVIAGALQEIYMNSRSINTDRLLLRPFPRGAVDAATKPVLWKKYREDMISRAGISIFLFGNKKNSGKIELADGVRSEYGIAVEQHNLLVPVGATGYVAREIWEEVNGNLAKFYAHVDDEFRDAFQKLNVKVDNEKLVDNILKFMELLKKR